MTTDIGSSLKKKFPSSKELNKPEWTSNEPLDKTFGELSVLIKLGPNDDAIDEIYKRIRPEMATDDSFKRRTVVIDALLAYLADIQLFSIQKKSKLGADMISIALHDMKTLGALTTLIVINGVYACLPTNVGIPLDKRRLKSFDKPMKFSRVPSPQNVILLRKIVTSLASVFSNGGDIKDLMLKGTGFTDVLTGAIYLLTRPGATDDEKNEFSALITNLERTSETYDLFLVYSLLIQPSTAPYFRLFISQRLAGLVTERSDGVQALIEYVGGLRDNEEISVEKLDYITRILLQKPKTSSAKDYFDNVGGKLYDILVFVNRPVMTSIATHIVESIFSINARIVIDFIFQRVWDSFNPPKSESESEIDTLTTESALNNAFNVFLTFTKNGSLEMMNTLLEPLIVPYWIYMKYQKHRNVDITLVKNALVSALHITNDVKWLDIIVQNLIVPDGNYWEFSVGMNEMTFIKEKITGITKISQTKLFDDMENAVDLLNDVLQDVEDDMVGAEFLVILRRWLKVSDSSTKKLVLDDEDGNPFSTLLDLRVLEGISEKHRERLSRSPDSMLDLVISVLEGFSNESGDSKPGLAGIVQPKVEDADSDDEDDEEQIDESLTIVLQLLSAILSETEELGKSSSDKLRKLKPLLQNISRNNKSAQALLDRINEILDISSGVLQSNKNPDELVLKRAITSLNDPLVPIRAHGLYLLRQLVENNSDVISVDFVVDLHLTQLKDPEPFVYLNVIKGLNLLLESARSEVLPQFARIYKDPASDLEERLRIGEVLLQFITRSGDSLTDDSASIIATTTLSMIRRHENMPKIDNRIRMSAMSILGMCCRVSPGAMLQYLPDVLDCVLGILKLETTEDQTIMRRSAIVLINDLISSTAGLYSIPTGYARSCLTALKYVKDTDVDVLVRHQAQQVLSHIKDLLAETIGV
ncbi:unnamed protein product [Kuraishia capsulata CBS 1993]|uniref:RNA polymerase II assembly factor Rtp1 C-terminal domain-containing protein n=1 Tax=Kuraishia capsulata CBS 1993 TaxID=1382522 RepID=W6MFG6_9ASCO|nr:uncharacterized protein KUCA_T00000286001 [Kuraishia capsulata CBS 1993]CDK24326.1 unnamed protein product [Kuraishia capsulata CBS 1993]